MTNWYNYTNGTQAGENIMYYFTYANSVTHNSFGFTVVLSFFLITLIGSMMAQLRFRGFIRPESSFLASTFLTLVFEIIIEQTSGILSPAYFMITALLFVIALLWIGFANNE